jgi:hypothetical protein
MTQRKSIDGLLGRGTWEPPDPARLAALQGRLSHDLPGFLRELYTRTGGGTVGRVDVFDLDELEDVNLHQRGYGEALPSALFFASDGADGFFFVDGSGTLGHGTGAVYWVSRGGVRPDLCRYCAADVPSFLRDAAEGKVTWTGKALRQDPSLDVRELLAAYRDRYGGRSPPKGAWAPGEAGRRLGVRLPDALADLLDTSDGLRIDRAGVTVFPAAQITAVPAIVDAEGRPELLWFAEEDNGRRWAVATGPWRKLQEGDVVSVNPGEDPAQAPRKGPLAAVLARWLET